jgi:hypothetical protein
MKKKKYVYAESYGMVYRFSQRNWKRALQEYVAGTDVIFSHYGRCMFVIDHHVTDFDLEIAKELLADMAAEKKGA